MLCVVDKKDYFQFSGTISTKYLVFDLKNFLNSAILLFLFGA